MKVETLAACLLCGGRDLIPLDEENCIWQCRACDYIFDNPRPVVEEIARFYSMPGKYDHWTAAQELRDRLWKRRLGKLARTRRPGNLLDVGAGTGQFLAHAQADYAAVHGTEVSASAIAIARVRYGIELTRGEVEDLEGEADYDNITLFHVLEHVPNPRSTLEKCYSLLREGGVLVVAVPNDVRSLKQRLKAVLGRWGIGKFRERGKLALPKIRLDGSLEEIHLSHFTPAVLQRLLESVGLRVVEASLDPYYVEKGWRRIYQDVYYGLCLLVWHGFRINLYDTIWMVGRKDSPGIARGQRAHEAR